MTAFDRATCIALASVLLWGCVHGREPPSKTCLVRVKGGEFLFGSEEPCFNESDPKLTCDLDAYGMPKVYPTVLVRLKDFYIEQHEVTNLQYRYCVAMGACTDPKVTTTPQVEDYYYNPFYDHYPMVNATQEQAEQYCEFIGRRLPTEVEWERVAAGPASTSEQKRPYPFEGATNDIASCRGKDIRMRYCDNKDTDPMPAPVKTSGDDVVMEGGRPVYDLTGNVAEWVAGRYEEGITCKDFLPPECDCFRCAEYDGQAKEKCQQDCYTKCEACTSNEDCFTMCDSDKIPGGLPICIKYPGGQAIDEQALFFDKGTEVLARGGSYTDGDNHTCRARTTDRMRHVDASKKQFMYDIGFRCAADQAEPEELCQ